MANTFEYFTGLKDFYVYSNKVKWLQLDSNPEPLSS